MGQKDFETSVRWFFIRMDIEVYCKSVTVTLHIYTSADVIYVVTHQFTLSKNCLFGRRRRHSIFYKVIKEKNRTTILGSKQHQNVNLSQNDLYFFPPLGGDPLDEIL